MVYDFVFIVLTYRNTEDLDSFIKCTKKTVKNSFKIIVVNSYYDEETSNIIRKISMDNDCQFLNVENKGYGYGNNIGVEYAKENFQFKFLIISNPDIEIKYLSLELLNKYEECIVAPTIKTLTGKNQNPYYYSKMDFIEYLNYLTCVYRYKIFAYIGIIINKIYRESALIIDKIMKVKKRRIYAAHGSFVIFGRHAIEKLGTLYDERMFLFAEENHLARLAHKKNIKTYMIPKIKVLHKEDGSVGFESDKMSSIQRESYIIYYENWNLKNKKSRR